MKVGTMSSREFVSGAGMARIRREKSALHLKTKAKEAKEKFHDKIGYFATLRMKLLIPWWHDKFPTRQLRVLFGNGEALPLIDGRHVFICSGLRTEIEENRDHPRGARRANVPEGTLLKELEEALRDVDDITNGFRDGCPEELVIEPIKATKRKKAVWQSTATSAG